MGGSGRSSGRPGPGPRHGSASTPALIRVHEGPAVVGDRPERVVRDLPRVAVRVRERERVAAPERLPGLASDRATRCSDLLGSRVRLLRRADVESQREARCAARVGHARVLGELGAIPERHDHPARLEENDVVLSRAQPPERFVELHRPLDVRDSERDHRKTLVHALLLCYSMVAIASPDETGWPSVTLSAVIFPDL